MAETDPVLRAIAALAERRDLPATLAAQAFGQVMAGEATPALMAALLMGLRVKGETAQELQGAVLVRHNYAQYPATKDKPAYRHDDLMVIHPASAEDQAAATYWDNEGHVIEYSAAWNTEGTTLTFLSKAGSGPQFRLVYKKADADTMTVSFDMAPPGQPSAFKPYTSGRLRRAGAP
jgi:hypothetical protein